MKLWILLSWFMALITGLLAFNQNLHLSTGACTMFFGLYIVFIIIALFLMHKHDTNS